MILIDLCSRLKFKYDINDIINYILQCQKSMLSSFTTLLNFWARYELPVSGGKCLHKWARAERYI
jgi:hypothetical protein